MKNNPPKADSRRPILVELERRLLLSADVPSLLADPGLAADAGLPEPPAQIDLLESEEPASQTEILARRELVIVDPGVEDYEQLVEDLRSASPADRGIEVVLLEPDRDGIAQIGEILAGYDNLDAVHIVSHGTDAGVQLGNAWLAADNLDAHASAVAGWSDALTLDADLLFYGCDLAESAEGKALVESLADLTGADVAASVDATGHAALGGDWQLEYATGGIEARVAFGAELQQSWTQVLAVGIGDTSTGTGNGASLSFSHDSAGSDRLLLVGVSMSNPGARTVSSISYDSQALSFVGSENNSNDKSRIEIWSLVAPNTGTNNLVVTLSGANGNGFTVGAMTFTGVDQATPLGTFSSASGHSAGGSTVVSSAAGELVFSTLNIQSTNNEDLIPDAGQTEHWDLHQNRADGGGSTAPGAASVTMSWSFGNDEWALGAVSIKPEVNDAPTALSLAPTVVDENVAAGSTVGTFSSTDPDTGDTFTYTLVAGVGDTDNGAFAIVGDELRIGGSPDFESQSSYAIRVRTTDAGGLSTEQTFTVTVNDLNEAPTALTVAPTAVDENVAAGSTVGTFSSTDPDTGDTFTYTLVAGAGDTDNGAFAIVGDELRISASPDFESQSSYAIRVRTTDAGRSP
jgi:hypothetical protein